MSEKIVGILGGMGPEATVDLMARVIRSTPAKDDVDHIRMIVDNNPKVPSRIKALLEGGGESPAPCLQGMARKLEAWGVDFLAMPCNTAHFYYREVQEAVTIPVLNMIELAVNATLARVPGLRSVGLIASTAVLDLKIYHHAFARKGVQVLAPQPPKQADLMTAIKTIKTCVYGDEVRTALSDGAADLTDQGAHTLLVACTELSIICNCIHAACPTLDAAQILAETIVKEAFGA